MSYVIVGLGSVSFPASARCEGASFFISSVCLEIQIEKQPYENKHPNVQ